MIKIPLPKGTRFGWRQVNPNLKQRLAFKKGTSDVIEVQNYYKRDGTWVKHHTRRIRR